MSVFRMSASASSPASPVKRKEVLPFLRRSAIEASLGLSYSLPGARIVMVAVPSVYLLLTLGVNALSCLLSSAWISF